MGSGDSVALQAVGAIGGDGVALQAVGTIGSDGVALQAVGTIGGDGVALQAVGAIGGDGVALQAIRTIGCDAILDQAIRTTLGHSAFNQTIRATFSDNRLNRGSGKSVNCENRESDAEEGLAFHDRVLRGVVGWYGADVTPRIFLENFIEVMVNIDAIDRGRSRPLVSVMMRHRALITLRINCNAQSHRYHQRQSPIESA
jgi:hypothetical protein